MKICFITDNIFTLGGVQRVVSVLSSELAKYYDVDILCITDKCKIDRELYNLSEKVNIQMKKDLIEKHILSKIYSKIIREINNKTELLNKDEYTELLANAYYTKEVQNKFIEYLNSRKYDVIIGVAGVYSILLGIISERLDSKTIGWQHNSYNAYLKTKGRYFWHQESIFKKYISKLDEYIVLTDEDKCMLKKKLNINCHRIYNPLSFESKKKSKCMEKSIISVGRLAEQQKGFDLLIKAFSKISINYNDWTLSIVGDGEDKDKLLKLINELNLSKQILIKPSTNNIKEYYLNSSVLISSSRWEGFGLVITEAMECGLPVIAFDNSGPKEIINKPNENGILVPCGDIDALAETMLYLIENEEKRKKLSKEAIVRAQDFSVSKICDDWNTVIKSLRK